MDFETIKAWLSKQTNRQIRIRWWLALLGLFLTPFGIAVGAFLVFVIAWVSTHDSSDPAIDAKCLWIALAGVPVLFVINRFMPRHEGQEKYYHDEPDTSFVGHYVNREKVKLRFLLWLLFTGPRLVDWWISSFRRIYRLQKQDTHSCAAVLWLLLLKGKRLAYADFQSEFDWLDVEATLPQLAWLPGMLYFKTQPPAVSLTEDLRTAIRQGTPP